MSQSVHPPEAVMEERGGKMCLPKEVPENLATLQHYDSRLSHKRGVDESAKIERTTLYCHSCNQRENEIEQARVPKAIRRIRSVLGHYRKKGRPRQKIMPSRSTTDEPTGGEDRREDS